MSQKLNAAIAVIGIDIGKNSFHIVGHDHRGAIVLRQKWSRGQVETRLANLPPCLIGMEACVGAHHLSRKLQMLGHDARLMPAKYVRPYSKGHPTRQNEAPNHGVFLGEAALKKTVYHYSDRCLRDGEIVTAFRDSFDTLKSLRPPSVISFRTVTISGLHPYSLGRPMASFGVCGNISRKSISMNLR
jgi:hypothetical protein